MSAWVGQQSRAAKKLRAWKEAETGFKFPLLNGGQPSSKLPNMSKPQVLVHEIRRMSIYGE